MRGCTRSVQNVSSLVIWKIETFIEENTRILNIGQWRFSPLQSAHLGTSHSSPNHHWLPHGIFLNLISGLKISSFSKVILILGKARSHRAQNLAYRGPESPGWFDVLPKELCRRRDEQVDVLLWWSCQSPVAHSCSILNHLNSFCGGMFKLNENLMQIHCSTCSVILNVMAAWYTCSLNGIYHPTD